MKANGFWNYVAANINVAKTVLLLQYTNKYCFFFTVLFVYANFA